MGEWSSIVETTKKMVREMGGEGVGGKQGNGWERCCWWVEAEGRSSSSRLLSPLCFMAAIITTIIVEKGSFLRFAVLLLKIFAR